LVFEADLKTDKHPSHWVLQGVCLVLNTDWLSDLISFLK
jgi:dynein heavy chain